MRLTLLLALLLATTACTSTPAATDAAPATPATAQAPTDSAGCAAAGGALKPLGRLQRVQCVVPYTDAGRACNAKADCTGQCLASGDTEIAAGTRAAGVCQTDVSQNFGCRQRIDNGVAQGTICVD